MKILDKKVENRQQSRIDLRYENCTAVGCLPSTEAVADVVVCTIMHTLFLYLYKLPLATKLIPRRTKVAVNVSRGEQTFPQIMVDFSLFVH